MGLVLQTVELLHASLCFVLFHPIPVLFTPIYTVACLVSYIIFDMDMTYTRVLHITVAYRSSHK
jgi:hypothetical protein